MKTSTCHTERKHYAKELCKPCYNYATGGARDRARKRAKYWLHWAKIAAMRRQTSNSHHNKKGYAKYTKILVRDVARIVNEGFGHLLDEPFELASKDGELRFMIDLSSLVEHQEIDLSCNHSESLSNLPFGDP